MAGRQVAEWAAVRREVAWMGPALEAAAGARAELTVVCLVMETEAMVEEAVRVGVTAVA